MPTMFAFLCLANAVFYAAHSSDFCAWNRAKPVPSDNNILATYNFINGEFNRDQSIENGGQTELFRGVPYYSMTLATCGPTVLYLYRHTDTVDFPPKNIWVIAAGLGTDPITGYAYCNAASADQDTPNGACDGQWLVGAPKYGSTPAGHVLDPDFKIMPGGCPQITCNAIKIWSANSDPYTPNYDSDTTMRTGTFNYFAPDIYVQSGAVNPTGYWYLFWNPKVWTWAIHYNIDEIERCNWYKSTSSFLTVGKVIDGPFEDYIDYTSGVWYFVSIVNPEFQRVMECIGTEPTPQPTAQAPVVPTEAPVEEDVCSFVGGGYAPTWQPYIDENCFTPAPIVLPQFTPPPTPQPTSQPNDVLPTPHPVDPTPPPTANTGNPTPGPTVPLGSPSRDPTPRPTTRPPTTPGPTVPLGYPSRSPTFRPTTYEEWIAGGGGQTSTTEDGDGVTVVGCNVYLVCVVVAVYNLI